MLMHVVKTCLIRSSGTTCIPNPNPNPNPNANPNPNPHPNPNQAIPVYTTARLLASINVEALARFEGFDVRAGDP